MTVNSRKKKVKEALALLQDRFHFRKGLCWKCIRVRPLCIPVKVMIKGIERQRMVCCDCLLDVCKEAVKKQKKKLK